MQMIVHKHSLESLHKKVPKRILPTHLGGEAGDILHIARKHGISHHKIITYFLCIKLCEFSERWKEHLIKNQAEFERNLKCGVDEKKIPKTSSKKSDDQFGVKGAFRKLDLD